MATPTRARLLVVDDEESVALTMGAVLELEGYAVSVVTSGTDAIRELNEQPFDLVLTDLRLDDRDGLAVVAEVARVQPETLSIILTGYASLESAIKALREGAYDYLIKPCAVDELRLAVARGLEHRVLGLQLKARMGDLEDANRTIRELNSDLQRRIDEATSELQSRMNDLARANAEIANLYRNAQEHVEQLQELDRLKSRFLSMASHELKTPLTSISGLAQVMLRRMQRRLQAGPPETVEWYAEQRGHLERLELLSAQTTRLGRLVDELLDVSRIESGKLELRMAEVDLAELVDVVVERMQLATTDHSIEFVIEPGADARVFGDSDHLEQVLDNLIGNAIKFSPDGGMIHVRLAELGDSVAVSVQDPGVGIEPDQLEAVFGLFYQAEDPRTRRAGGMGLGLYISKDIITRHGGRIWVDSRPGEGSTFHVALPRAVRDEPVESASGLQNVHLA